jgi:hypothetical protein
VEGDDHVWVGHIPYRVPALVCRGVRVAQAHLLARRHAVHRSLARLQEPVCVWRRCDSTRLVCWTSVASAAHHLPSVVVIAIGVPETGVDVDRQLWKLRLQQPRLLYLSIDGGRPIRGGDQVLPAQDRQGVLSDLRQLLVALKIRCVTPEPSCRELVPVAVRRKGRGASQRACQRAAERADGTGGGQISVGMGIRAQGSHYGKGHAGAARSRLAAAAAATPCPTTTATTTKTATGFILTPRPRPAGAAGTAEQARKDARRPAGGGGAGRRGVP